MATSIVFLLALFVTWLEIHSDIQNYLKQDLTKYSIKTQITCKIIPCIIWGVFYYLTH